MPLRGHGRQAPFKSITIALALLAIGAGCGDLARPSAPVGLAGEFSLEAVDGQTLPVLVSFTGTDCMVTQGTLRVTTTGKWDWSWVCAGQLQTEHGAGGWLDQPAVDSIVFPMNAPTDPTYWGAGRVRNGRLEVSTLYPRSTSPRQPVAPTVFGEHRWTFRSR